MAFNSRGGKAKEIIDSIPSDGCLLIFNGIHMDFRRAAHATGCLSVHVCDNGKVEPEYAHAVVRDLYIKWRE